MCAAQRMPAGLAGPLKLRQEPPDPPTAERGGGSRRAAADAALAPVAQRPVEAARATTVVDASTSLARYARPTPGRDGRLVWRGFLSFEMSPARPRIGRRRI